jgi:hypothetical protein
VGWGRCGMGMGACEAGWQKLPGGSCCGCRQQAAAAEGEPAACCCPLLPAAARIPQLLAPRACEHACEAQGERGGRAVVRAQPGKQHHLRAAGPGRQWGWGWRAGFRSWPTPGQQTNGKRTGVEAVEAMPCSHPRPEPSDAHLRAAQARIRQQPHVHRGRAAPAVPTATDPAAAVHEPAARLLALREPPKRCDLSRRGGGRASDGDEAQRVAAADDRVNALPRERARQQHVRGLRAGGRGCGQSQGPGQRRGCGWWPHAPAKLAACSLQPACTRDSRPRQAAPYPCSPAPRPTHPAVRRGGVAEEAAAAKHAAPAARQQRAHLREAARRPRGEGVERRQEGAARRLLGAAAVCLGPGATARKLHTPPPPTPPQAALRATPRPRWRPPGPGRRL